MPPPTDSAAKIPEDSERSEVSTNEPGGTDWRAIAVILTLLVACVGLVGYGILDTPEKPKPRAIPTADVTYAVTGEGTADISYLARNEAGDATVVSGVKLPWKKSVQVPIGKAPTVYITLNEKGGKASCTLAIRGKHVQRAMAIGKFGRATCTGALPKGDGSLG